MRNIIVALAFVVSAAQADVLVNGDGATCDVPKGYNVGPFDPVWNTRGMKEFCVFPFQPWAQAIADKLASCEAADDFVAPDLPECGGLVVSPAVQKFPCYEVKYD